MTNAWQLCVWAEGDVETDIWEEFRFDRPARVSYNRRVESLSEDERETYQYHYERVRQLAQSQMLSRISRWVVNDIGEEANYKKGAEILKEHATRLPDETVVLAETVRSDGSVETKVGSIGLLRGLGTDVSGPYVSVYAVTVSKAPRGVDMTRWTL